MGMDVSIEGELTIPANKVPEAGRLLLASEGYGDKSESQEIPATAQDVFKLIKECMERIGVALEDDGSLSFGLEDSTRSEELDQWIFRALAPVIDDGEFYMAGDEYQWMWEIKNGKFREVYAETVYDHDQKAVPTIAKLVALIYPGDQPSSADATYAGGHIVSPEHGMCLSLIEEVEDLLRETGYGPQAGMNELDRMAEV